MPTGKVKWFDAKKGFGFLAADDGQEVFLPSSALPSGATTVKPGTRMEFGVAQGRRGAQALSARILDRTPSVAKNVRKPAEEMVVVVESWSGEEGDSPLRFEEPSPYGPVPVVEPDTTVILPPLRFTATRSNDSWGLVGSVSSRRMVVLSSCGCE